MSNIIHQGLPSRTALRVATVRAVHGLLDEPIVLHDPVALPILGRERAAALEEDPFVHNDTLSRGLRAALVVRSRFAEDEVARAYGEGVRQYVVLGAGLDTFAYRNPHAGLRVFEVDHPSTQAWKRRCLAEAGIPLPPDLTFAPVDFERDTLMAGLLAAGFDAGWPAVFSWLGVTMYLSREAVLATLGVVAGLPRGSAVTCDFRVPAALLNPVERVISDLVAARVAAEGEPWIATFEPEELRARCLDLGFAEATVWEPDALNQRYLHRRKDGLRSNGRLLCARV